MKPSKWLRFVLDYMIKHGKVPETLCVKAIREAIHEMYNKVNCLCH